jgi:hypothetical protein
MCGKLKISMQSTGRVCGVEGAAVLALEEEKNGPLLGARGMHMSIAWLCHVVVAPL